MKNHTTIIFWALFFAGCAANKDAKNQASPHQVMNGKIAGIPYQMVFTTDTTGIRHEVDSILGAVYSTLSITVDGSIVDRINAFGRRDTLFCFNDSLGIFAGIFDPVKDIWRKTGGYYDPSLRPLMRAWAEINSGLSDQEPNLDSLYQFVGFDESKFSVTEQFDNEVYRETQIMKRDTRSEIDFGRVLFAYALDHVHAHLNSKGISNFRLQVGNNYTASQSFIDSLAYVRLELPDSMLSENLDIHERAFAFKSKKDKVGAVDGTYGYPVENNVEYVGVIASDALHAEAYATAFLAMGVDEVLRFYNNYPDEDIEALIIYREGDQLKSASTGGFDSRIAAMPAEEVSE